MLIFINFQENNWHFVSILMISSKKTWVDEMGVDEIYLILNCYVKLVPIFQELLVSLSR